MSKPGPQPGSPQRGGNHPGKDRHLMLSIRVSTDELALVNAKAQELGVSKADLIVMAVKKYSDII